MHSSGSHFVFTQTNDAQANEVAVYERGDDDRLAAIAASPTGGRGNGRRMPSQSSIVVSPDERFLLVANAGSEDVSVFAIASGDLVLADRKRVEGAPTSVAVHGDVVYVLTTGENAGVAGFRIDGGGRLSALRGDTLELSAPRRGPCASCVQPRWATLVVSERGTSGGMMQNLRRIPWSSEGFWFHTDARFSRVAFVR